jgi:hypothetical protein
MHNPGSTLTGPLLRLARSARLLALLAVAVAGVTTACSSSSTSSPAHATGHAARSAGGSLAYSACMRSHGVHNFPDPSAGSNGQQVTIQQGSGIDPNSPAFQAAQRSCQSLLPAGKRAGGSVSPAERARILRYAACIRAHGVPNYPDPTFNGNAINFGDLSGIANLPQYQSALRACASLNPMHGYLSSK